MRECSFTGFAAGRKHMQALSPSTETAHIEALTAMTSRASRIGVSSADSSALLLWCYAWQCRNQNVQTPRPDIDREDPKLICTSTWKGTCTALMSEHVTVSRMNMQPCI